MQRSHSSHTRRRVAASTRRARPTFESLDRRLLLSTLALGQRGTLLFTAGAGFENALTISLSGGLYTFADTAQPIQLSGAGATACGGGGTNSVSCSASAVTGIDVALGDGDDSIQLNAVADLIALDGQAGSDRYAVQWGNLGRTVVIDDSGSGPADFDLVQLDGSDGPDQIVAQLVLGAGIRIRNGDEMIDIVLGEAGRGADSNVMHGRGGDDRIDTSDVGGVPLTGGDGNDTLIAGSDPAVLDGGPGHDSLVGGRGAESLIGGSGNDTIEGGGGNDTLQGGSGADLLEGGSGNDRIKGQTGRDALRGGAGDDSLIGNGGNDYLRGGDGNDLLTGKGGHDRLEGGSGDDTIHGEVGDDTLVGGFGADHLFGGEDLDVLESDEDDPQVLADPIPAD